MTGLRYVCLSDVHFGAANSLLTSVGDDARAEPLAPSPVLVALVDCLRSLITGGSGARKPTLVLHGDVLDLALSSNRDSAMAFERFVELAWPARGESLFDDRVICVPGNHDHALWDGAAKQLYREVIAAIPPGQPLPRLQHVSPMFSTQVPAPLLSELVARGSQRRADATKVYPSLGLLSPDGRRGVVISHGHYIESIYRAQSHLLTLLFPDHQMPDVMSLLEWENGNWIDYFWSSMGTTGPTGKGVALIYNKLQSRDTTNALLAQLAKGLAARFASPRWLQWFDAKALDLALEGLVSRMAGLARNQTQSMLGADAQEGLRWFLERPVLGALQEELGPRVPVDVTFVFGHTHKPFQAVDTFAGYDAPVKLFNSGGWVVDTPQANPLEGGAVILIDEALNVASLRMYNESADAASYAVKVEDTGSATGHPGPLCEALGAAIDPAAEPWATFSARTAHEVERRATQLRALMKTRF